MFTEFENQVWTVSSGAVVVTDNTDFSIDGTSKKIVYTSGTDEYATLTFDEIDLSGYEEISFHIQNAAILGTDNIFKLTVDGTDYNFKNTGKNWSHVLIDCQEITSLTEIKITSLISGITIFFDYAGYRKTRSSDMDLDVTKALKNHISLDYDVATTLTADVTAGDTSISLASKAYIYDTTVLIITEGGTSETVSLLKRDGTLKDELVNSFTSEGATVTAVCPTEIEDYADIEPDPVCGIAITDTETDHWDASVTLKDGAKRKRDLGKIGITIYIDCRSKKKTLQLAREFAEKYGKEFIFLLDGELVNIYLESESFIDNEIGNNPRKALFYMIELQPITISTKKEIDTINITMESREI